MIYKILRRVFILQNVKGKYVLSLKGTNNSVQCLNQQCNFFWCQKIVCKVKTDIVGHFEPKMCQKNCPLFRHSTYKRQYILHFLIQNIPWWNVRSWLSITAWLILSNLDPKNSKYLTVFSIRPLFWQISTFLGLSVVFIH